MENEKPPSYNKFRLLFISEYYGENDGPAGIVFKKFIEGLRSDHRFEFDVVSGGAFKDHSIFHIKKWLVKLPYFNIIEDWFFSQLTGHPKVGSWGWRATNAIKKNKLSKNTYDLVVAWSNPISSLYVGAEFCKKFNTPLLWRFDDPYPPYNYPNVPGWQPPIRHMEFEKSWINNTIKNVSFFSAPTQELGNLMMVRLGQERSFCEWPHLGGIAKISDSAKKIAKKIKLDTSILNIAYLGRVSDNRDIRLFLKTLLAFNRNGYRSKLHIFGDINNKWHSDVNKYIDLDLVEVHGSVSYEVSLCLMKKFDALYLLEAMFDSPVFLPSKLVDYVWAKKPLLISTPNGSAVERILGGSGFPGLLGQTDKSQLKCLMEFVACVNRNKTNRFLFLGDDFQEQNVFDKFYRFLKKNLL
ncbi:MAG: hypothetical protein PHQ11_01575 [Paludibacter sp.]|nr:hypothetical protein [Paludibacter sp.]MDD4072539.1 hypothetical protein [Desulfobacterales bacterium]MDD4428533.1 hypothetical protein [Paludibacter sp.]